MPNELTLGRTTPNTDTKWNSIINSFTDDTMLRVYRANGIYQPRDLRDWDTFYRFPRMDPYRIAGKTREYIFITKPDLHIFDKNSQTLNPELKGSPFFADMIRRGYSNILKNLQYSMEPTMPYIRAFTNLKRSNVDISTIQSSDQDTPINQFGTKIEYRKSSISSDDDADFSIEFEDSKYLEVYLWFKAYDEYERRKFEGKVTPPDDSYRTKRILHDQMTIFKIIVGENGEDIIHFSRITGCYPKNVNRDAFSELPEDGHIRLVTQWHGTFVKDMDYDIIYHFNYLAKMAGYNSTSKIIDMWDPDIQAISGEDVNMPRIIDATSSESKYMLYRLVWG